MRLLLFTFLLSGLSFGQDRNGISYQALIINPNIEQLPGQDNDHAPLTNTDICLQFHIINSSGNYEYSESQSVTTDVYGMVNLVIGTGRPIGAITWDAVAWSAEAKSLKVDLDITGACTSFTELSNQQLTSVPFALYSPASNVPGLKGDSAYDVWIEAGNTGTEQEFIDSLKGVDGSPGVDGDSAYDVWIEAGNTGTEQEFIDSLKGVDGSPGVDGDSAYDVWIEAGNTGTEQEFIDSLKGVDGDPGEGIEGDSAYEVWIGLGNTGTEQEFIDSLKGVDGDPGEGIEGDSAYEVWIGLGNTGTEQEFLDSLKGPAGDSAYDVWIGLGNTGTEQEFYDSLKGDKGDPGLDGSNNTGSSMYFTEIEEKQIILSKTSCETLDNDVDGMISPPGSGWTTNAALNFSSCWRTPNGSYKGGCESQQQWTPPINCRIEPKTPLPSIVEHFYENINSSKIVITPPAGNQSFEISMKLEFMNANGDLISSFVEHSYVESYSKTKYYSSETTHEFLLNTINPTISTYRPINELIFQLSENVVSLKITYEAIAPENPPNDFYVLVPGTYNSSGGSISYNWLQQGFVYEIFVWR